MEAHGKQLLERFRNGELGDRKNEGKLQWSNMPLFLFRPLIRVADFGAKKYDKFNYLKGLSVTTCTDSAMRHLDAFLDPNSPDVDKESGEPHLAHAAWNLIVACYMSAKPELDDRWKGQING